MQSTERNPTKEKFSFRSVGGYRRSFPTKLQFSFSTEIFKQKTIKNCTYGKKSQYLACCSMEEPLFNSGTTYSSSLGSSTCLALAISRKVGRNLRFEQKYIDYDFETIQKSTKNLNTSSPSSSCSTFGDHSSGLGSFSHLKHEYNISQRVDLTEKSSCCIIKQATLAASRTEIRSNETKKCVKDIHGIYLYNNSSISDKCSVADMTCDA
uniref:Uncharacterized protein n=1 Tax=Romanomermis culicivorax TaxID=13658 RepID=A0A915IGP6_ROMCU